LLSLRSHHRHAPASRRSLEGESAPRAVVQANPQPPLAHLRPQHRRQAPSRQRCLEQRRLSVQRNGCAGLCQMQRTWSLRGLRILSAWPSRGKHSHRSDQCCAERLLQRPRQRHHAGAGNDVSGRTMSDVSPSKVTALKERIYGTRISLSSAMHAATKWCGAKREFCSTKATSKADPGSRKARSSATAALARSTTHMWAPCST